MEVEKLTVKGKLGPLGVKEGEVSLDLRPFTVLVGEQGVGKSLLSQFLYFFRDAPYLFFKYSSKAPLRGESLTSWIIDRLRSGTATSQSLSSIISTPTVSVKHEFGGVARSISIHRERRPRFNPLGSFKKEIERWTQLSVLESPLQQAVFVPDERSYYSRLFNTSLSSLGDSATLSIPMLEFTRILELAAGVSVAWQKGEYVKPPKVQQIESWAETALKGHAYALEYGSFSKHWVWKSLGSDSVLDIEMISSGQKEAWPLIATLETIFAKKELSLGNHFSLYVEEPEAHLHPAAQAAMLKILVYMVQQGHRVVITTHSLTVLYALNNLIRASFQSEDAAGWWMPEVRLAPEDVAAYLLMPDGEVKDIMNREDGFISEADLASTDEYLSAQFNALLG